MEGGVAAGGEGITLEINRERAWPVETTQAHRYQGRLRERHIGAPFGHIECHIAPPTVRRRIGDWESELGRKHANTVLPDCNTGHFTHSHAALTSISGGNGARREYRRS